MKIGLKIKELRVEKGMTQETLAEKTNLTTRTIQRIENGEVDPRDHSLQMIAKALDVDFNIFRDKGADQESDEKKTHMNNWLALVHLSGLFLLFLPTIILWHLKKDTVTGIGEHYRAVITFQFHCWLGFILPGLFIYWWSNHTLPLIFGLIISGLLLIDNTVKVFNNKPYNYVFRKKSKSKNS